MWRSCYSILLVLLLTANEKAQASDWERQLWQSKLNTSTFTIAGNIVHCDTLRLARHYNPTDVSQHFVSASVTDSLFNDYVSRTRKKDSVERELRMRAFNIMVAKANEKARKLKQPYPVFMEPIKEERLFIYDMQEVKRYRIKITEVLKQGDSVKRSDTITVIVLPARKWDSTSSIKRGKVVVYSKPYDNKEEVIQKEYFTPGMLDFYKHEHIYFITPDRIESEQWKAILVQYQMH